MDHDLFFLVLLARALSPGATMEQVRDTLLEIERLGRLPEFARGYDSYRVFLFLIARYARELADDSAATPVDWDFLVDVAADRLDDTGAAMALLGMHPPWRQAFDELATQCRPLRAPASPPRLVLLRNGRVRLDMTPGTEATCHTIERAAPGRYTLELDGGRVLWERVLGQQELIWQFAFPGVPLPLAADTVGGVQPPRETVRVALLDGFVEVRVHPGLENGTIELRLPAFYIGDHHAP